MGVLVGNTSHLDQKGKKKTESSDLAYYQKEKKPRNFRCTDYAKWKVDDKVCEQVSMTMLSEVYPTEVIECCVQQSEPWLHQSAAGAAEHGLDACALCDRDGAVEPPQPMPGLAQPGGQAQRSASGCSPRVR